MLPTARGRAKVVRTLGKVGVARDMVQALMLDRGLELRFSAAVEDSAQAAVAAASSNDPADGARRDLRELPTFTIDPQTAKDFDDAISAEREAESGHIRVWVHIADVSAYVRPDSPVDAEAKRRASSVYVRGAVEPMLPESLSNAACSIVPGKDRLAVSAEMVFDGPQVLTASFCRSLIRSDMRLSYEEVDDLFAAGAQDASQPWIKALALAREVAAAIAQARGEAGSALAIQSTEPEFRFDSRGHVARVEQSMQTEAHHLIEHLMVAANEQVARLLDERGIPALYRVHELPSAERAQRLVAQLASLGVPTPPVAEGPLSGAEAAEVIAACSRSADEYVLRTGSGRRALTSLVLRSLKQARYDPECLGHAGLSLSHYCHFTSPIRRYPDLVCHRALLSAIGAGEQEPSAADLAELAASCSDREREAMAIERDADDMAHCLALEKQLFSSGWDTVFEGEVTGVIGAGAFIAFGESGAEGMLPLRRMDDWYELNEQGTILFGDRSAIRLGDRIFVGVHRIDAARGRIDLEAKAQVELETKPRAKGKKGSVEPRSDDSPKKVPHGKKRKAPQDDTWEPAQPKQRKGRKAKAKARAEKAEKARKEKARELRKERKRAAKKGGTKKRGR
jgi:ribonuclease R